MYRALSALLGASFLMATPALAQYRCDGAGGESARSAYEEGRDELREATRRATGTPEQRAHAAAALDAFERMCSAGDSFALEWIGIAHQWLEQWVPAAEAYDQFVAVHELGRLSPDVRARLQNNLRMVDRRVATLVLLTNVPATVRLSDGRIRRSGAPIRIDSEVEALSLHLEAVGHEPTDLELGTGPLARLSPGARVELAVELRPSLVSDVTSEAPPEAESPVLASAHPEVSDITPVLVTGAAGVGAFVTAGVLFSLWAEDRATLYNASCPGATMLECESLANEFDTANALRIASFSLAGVALLATAVAWLIHLASRPRLENAR
ncbi:MAG: hypothetical protein EVA89_12795 [Sandaracinaceae bacterium]|nr:MAG: hypothetical protein EVA89_12795 [Sandaracinaceae bacterium]